MAEQPYGIEVWETAVVEDDIGVVGHRYYLRIYFTANGRQFTTSHGYKAKHERDEAVENYVTWVDHISGGIKLAVRQRKR